MSFWTDPNVRILPKFRFFLDFGGIIWWVKTAQFPKLSQEKSEVQTGFGGNVVYKPGPAKWQPITVTFADVMIPQKEGMTKRDMSTQMFWFGIANVLDDHQQNEGFIISRTNGFYDNGFDDAWITANFTEDGRKINKIEIEKQYQSELDANEKWILENILVSEIDFGGGDYNSDDLNEISVTLSYDIARPETTDSGSPFFSADNAEAEEKYKKSVNTRKQKRKPRKRKTIITVND